MAEASSSLHKEEDNENLMLVEYFQKHDFWLRTVHLRELPILLKDDIAVLFGGEKEDVEWMIFLEEIGVKKHLINCIRCSKATAPPLFTAFNLMHEENLGHVMEAFAKMKRFNILRYVHPYVESLLLKGRNLVQPTAPLLSDSSDATMTEKKSTASKESNEFQLSFFPKDTSPKLQNPRINFPSKDNSILVFIQHAMCDKKYAVQLAAELRKHRFKVFLSDDIYPFLRIDCDQIITDLYRKVDFIVPLISGELWKQIKSRTNYDVDLETKSNRFIYDLAKKEYFNLLKNYRVRPVVTSHKINVPFDNDSILSNPFYLWKEFSQFIKDLNFTFKDAQELQCKTPSHLPKHQLTF